ncbi:MAG: hypothetical protein KGI64_09370 [Xanthomonadaceae bacterium]|nr:hypothetical protein [Xanthomonadaceae bacterium]MDE1960866.1 hypothetical protein [Xanthomonadaceae bacterium]MDE2085057.1 hypothetical protein [Xanthomonadaceae bacterium]MDE2257216.1 hypothetical protein [Xanthomonadaceae bacterium]
MLVSTPLVPDAAPLARTVRGNGRIVWQQHYEGISHVAYRGGKAIAGVSGPWSDRYALIWWDRPLAPNPLELFATLDEAMRAVAEFAGEAVAEVCPRAAPKPHISRWWHSLWPRRRPSSGQLARLRRQLDADMDLSGLNFCASR